MTVLNFRIVIVLLAVLLPSSNFVAEAATVVRSGDVVSISDNEVVEGDFYSAATTINLSGIMQDDVHVLAGHVNVNGLLNNGAFIIAGGVDVHSSVKDDLRIVGGKAIIGGDVEGDLFFMGGELTILSTSNIKGDLLIYSGEAIVHGSVGGNLIGSIGDLNINSDIIGNVDVRVSNIVLGDQADIKGSLTYSSSQTVIQSLNANVVGEIIRNDTVLPQTDDYKWPWMAPSLMFLFSCLTWYLVSRSSLNILMNHALSLSLRPLFYGVGTFFVLPVISGLLILSTIGTLSGIIIFLLYASSIVLAITATIPILGQALLMLLTKRDKSNVTILTVISGVIAFGLLCMLGVAGYIVLILASLISLGGIVDVIMKFILSKKHLLF